MSEPKVPGIAAVSAASSSNARSAAETAAVPGKKRRLAAVAALLALAVALAAVAVWYFAIREREPRNDLERFQGDWQIAVATGGEPRRTNNAIRVTGDRWEYVTDATTKAYRVTLNETANPKEIDLELLDVAGLRGARVKMHGVYAFDGNKTVRVRINVTTEPRPATLDEPDANVWVLTKVKLEAQPK
jgi:uncharacterized protein (TIGR03067 family)